MIETYSHQDAYEDLLDLIQETAKFIEEHGYIANEDLDAVHYAFQVENSLRRLNGHKHFED